VKILLDTNALIWWMEDLPHLGAQARARISHPDSHILASLASIWEITVKWRAGKHPVSGAPYAAFLADQGVGVLGICATHVAALENLELHHKDPFDHIILAQAVVEAAQILTSDREMASYGVPCIQARR
jgi:PIN domain nuclease of toxin-antitoxin system